MADDEHNPDKLPASTGLETRVGMRLEYLWPMREGVWLKIIIVNDDITSVFVISQ